MHVNEAGDCMRSGPCRIRTRRASSTAWPHRPAVLRRCPVYTAQDTFSSTLCSRRRRPRRRNRLNNWSLVHVLSASFSVSSLRHAVTPAAFYQRLAMNTTEPHDVATSIAVNCPLCYATWSRAYKDCRERKLKNNLICCILAPIEDKAKKKI